MLEIKIVILVCMNKQRFEMWERSCLLIAGRHFLHQTFTTKLSFEDVEKARKTLNGEFNKTFYLYFF